MCNAEGYVLLSGSFRHVPSRTGAITVRSLVRHKIATVSASAGRVALVWCGLQLPFGRMSHNCQGDQADSLEQSNQPSLCVTGCGFFA